MPAMARQLTRRPIQRCNVITTCMVSTHVESADKVAGVFTA